MFTFSLLQSHAMGMGQENRVRCPILFEWKDQAANAGALGRIFARLKLNLKEEQLSALSVLRQLSKEKSRFWKRSDLFDDFVISVLELRLFHVCFKRRKSWHYVRG